MAEFYNRYRNLFALQQEISPPRQDFLRKKDVFANRSALEPIPFLSDRPFLRKSPNLARTPALDEFEYAVLPKLIKEHPESKFQRLRTEMQQNTNKMKEVIKVDSKPDRPFYQLPKAPLIYSKPVQTEQRSRIHTQPHEPKEDKGPDLRHLSKNMDQLERLYMGRQMARYKKDEQAKEDEQTIQRKMKDLQKERMANEESIKTGKFAGVQEGYAKKWDIKTLPYMSKPVEQHNKPQTSDYSPQQKLSLSREKQLYGEKVNPYAFVNSKVEDIRRSQKYYPRGYINQYRDAIYRRRVNKNNIEVRRNKLKQLIEEDEYRFRKHR